MSSVAEKETNYAVFLCVVSRVTTAAVGLGDSVTDCDVATAIEQNKYCFLLTLRIEEFGQLNRQTEQMKMSKTATYFDFEVAAGILIVRSEYRSKCYESIENTYVYNVFYMLMI